MISRRKLLVGGATLLAAPAFVQRYSWAKPPPLLTADLAAFLWMNRPPHFTVPAWFPVRVNRGHWFGLDLLFCGIFNGNGRLPIYTSGFAIGNNGTMPSNFGNPGGRLGGPCLIGGGQYDMAGSALNMKFSGTAGSVLCHTSYSWAYNDGFSYNLFDIGAPTATNRLSILKFSDSNLYAGWSGSSDTRVVVSASFMGSNDGGIPATIGCSWNGSGTTAYFNTNAVGNTGTAPNSSTTAFDVFNVNRTSLPWLAAGNAYDGIYGFHLFNRALTAAEHQEFFNDPCCGLEPDYGLLMSHYTAPPSGRSRGLIVN